MTMTPNLICALVALSLGILFTLGFAFGGDTDGDDGDHDGGLSLPLFLRAAIFCYCVGAVAAACHVLGYSNGLAWTILLGFFAKECICMLLVKIFPTYESYNVLPEDFVGAEAEVTTVWPINEQEFHGQIKVKLNNDLHFLFFNANQKIQVNDIVKIDELLSSTTEIGTQINTYRITKV